MTKLTLEEIAFFGKYGYVVKRNVLSNELCDKAIDLAWQKLPVHFDPKSPDSWRGSVSCQCIGSVGLYKRRGRVKLREEIRDEPFLIDLLPANSTVHQIAERLLGREVFCPEVRGIYIIFPMRAISTVPPAHIDQHPMQLGVIGYLDDVYRRGGCFQVWPGSHRKIYRTQKFKLTWSPTRSYRAAFKDLDRREPVSISGTKGDVIFYHHRLLHSPSLNRSSRPRFAMLCDFVQCDAERLLKERPSNDPFEDWAVDLSFTRNARNFESKKSIRRAIYATAHDFAKRAQLQRVMRWEKGDKSAFLPDGTRLKRVGEYYTSRILLPGLTKYREGQIDKFGRPL